MSNGEITKEYYCYIWIFFKKNLGQYYIWKLILIRLCEKHVIFFQCQWNHAEIMYNNSFFCKHFMQTLYWCLCLLSDSKSILLCSPWKCVNALRISDNEETLNIYSIYYRCECSIVQQSFRYISIRLNQSGCLRVHY